MQLQIVYSTDFIAEVDTKDLVNAASVDASIIASVMQLSCSKEIHADPMSGTGEFAPGLWCHVYGYDYARRTSNDVIRLSEVGHVPIVSAGKLKEVLEVKASGLPLIKRLQGYGLVSLQALYVLANTCLDNTASMSLVTLISELFRYFARVNPDKTDDEVAGMIVERGDIPYEVVVFAVNITAAQEAAYKEV